MELIDGKRPKFTETKYGFVPVKIGTDKAFLPGYERLYYQAPGFKYPYSWGEEIKWINVIQWEDGSIEVWSDKHPDDPSWSPYAANPKNYFRDGNIAFKQNLNSTTGAFTRKEYKVTFIHHIILTAIARRLFTRWSNREADLTIRGANKFPDTYPELSVIEDNTPVLNSQAMSNRFRYVKFSVQYYADQQNNPISALTRILNVNHVLYLNTLNNIPGTTIKCDFASWPSEAMFNFRFRGISVPVMLNDFIPHNPDLTGYTNYLFSASLSFVDLYKFFSEFGIDDVSLATYPDNKYFSLLSSDLILPGTEEVVTEVQQPQQEPETTTIITPEVVTPEVVTPEVVTPEVVTPEVVTPEVVTPEVVTPTITPKPTPPIRPPSISSINATAAANTTSQVPTSPGPGQLGPLPGVVPQGDQTETTKSPEKEELFPVPEGDDGKSVGSQPLDDATKNMVPDTIPLATDTIAGWVDERLPTDPDLVAGDQIEEGGRVPQNTDTIGSMPLYIEPEKTLDEFDEITEVETHTGERIYYPFGHPKWGNHVGKLREADTDGEYCNIGTSCFGRHFSPPVDLWFIRKR